MPASNHVERTEKRSERIARQILSDIAAKSLSEGSSLESEVDMTLRYGVGRATVREALRLLEVQGLITIRPGPGGGPVIGRVNAADFGRMAAMHFQLAGLTLKDLQDARNAVEPWIARLAASRPDREALEVLRSFTRDAAEQVASADPIRPFHRTLMSTSASGVLNLIGGSLVAIYEARFPTVLMQTAEPTHAAIQQHARIAEAILAGDADEAERLTREHMVEFSAVAESLAGPLLDEVVTW